MQKLLRVWKSFVLHFGAFCAFKIALIASLYYTTGVYPCQPTYQEYIFMHLFLFLIICENFFFLWEFFWISSYLWSSVRIYFLSLYENKQEYEYHHLKQISCHNNDKNRIMIFCWFLMFPFYVFCLEFSFYV